MTSPSTHKTPGRRGALVALAVAVAAGAASVAVANDTILHEFFVVPTSNAGPSGEGPTSVEDEAAAELSESLTGGEEAADVQQPPTLTIENRGDELEYDGAGRPVTPGGEVAPEHNGPHDGGEPATMDRETTLDASLSYYSVFNPSVAPWKRGSARNHVGEDFSLTVVSPRKRLAVEDRPVRVGYERFWGSMLVRMEAGQPVPLPSVAAQVNILRYQTEPPVRLTFHHEYLADNYFVTGDRTGTVRVNFLMEAHSSYFGGDVDPKVQVEQLPANMRPRLPANVQRAAERAIEHIGVDREAPFRDQLRTLVDYFRSFEARDFPEELATDNVYLDIVHNKLGVCRHRALAFTITAQALGIFSRYVHNEAHAFVEVYVPNRGWLRIDLGGAAVDFELRNTDDKVLHVPPEPDAMPTPENFSSSYSHRVGSGQQEADVDGDGSGGEAIDGVPPQTTGARLRGADLPQVGVEPDGEQTESPQADLPFPEPDDGDAAGQAPAAARRATRLEIHAPPPRQSVFRGDEVTIGGRLLTDQGLPLVGKKIQAYLVPAGDHRTEAFERVGSGLTDDRGRVEVTVQVPETAKLGRWSLYLFFPGDENFDRSHSE